MHRKKRFVQAVVVCIAGVVLYTFGVWKDSRREMFTGEKEKCVYPTKTEAAERAKEEPLLCVPVREAYTPKEETGIAEGLLAELQEYVRRGEQSEVIAAYRDETILLDVEEMLALCPEYEKLIAEGEERGSIDLCGQNALQDIDKIYQLSSDREDGNTLLIQYAGYEEASPDEAFGIFLGETDTGYQAGSVRLGAGGADRWCSEAGCGVTVVFAWEEDGEKEYYLLEMLTKGALYVRRLVLQEDWEEKLESGVDGFFDGDIRYIRQETTRAVPDFYYLNRKSRLLPVVKEYVEANMACFADKLYGWDGIVYRDLTIWGDEEQAVFTEEEKKQIEEALDKRIYSLRIVGADYDNDGEAELFLREKGEEVRLLFWEDGIWKTKPARLYGEEPAAQMWFVECAGKTVTFAITLPYGEAYPLLSAYLIEEGQKTLLLTCQLVYGDTVEIGGSRSMREGFGYQDMYGFCKKVPLAERRQVLPWEALMEEMETVCGEAGITPVWEEQPFSESFLSFIRQSYGSVLAGRAKFWQGMEPYEIDRKEDRENLLRYAGEENAWMSELCVWAYRYTTRDGADAFLADIDSGGTLGVCTLAWFWAGEEGTQYVELADYYRGDYSGVVQYEGQIYGIITDYDFGTKNLRGVHILPLNEEGEWEHYYLSLTPDVEGYRLLCLYGGQEAALAEYVDAVYKEVIAASMEEDIFTGTGENAAITAELRRSIKNKNIYAFENHYQIIDADNDGEREVVHTEYFLPSSYHQSFSIEYYMYGYRDGKFAEFDMRDILDGCDAYNRTEEGSSYRISCYPVQLWFEEIDGVTYLFTLDLLSPTSHYLLRAYVIRDGAVEDAGVWMLRAAIMENIEEAGYVSRSRG